MQDVYAIQLELCKSSSATGSVVVSDLCSLFVNEFPSSPPYPISKLTVYHLILTPGQQ